MKTDSIHRAILALSIPCIITNITTPLLGIIDVAIVGHMGGAVYLAAIALGSAMFNMLYWLFAFLRMGTSGMTAQAFGADDQRAYSLILYRAIIVAISAGALMIILQSPISSAVLYFMDANDLTISVAREYFNICIWGAPAVLGTYALSGWFLGMQNSKATMCISLFINILNIAISLILVYVFDFGIKGVATGTLIAQWGGFLLGIIMCLYGYTLKKSAINEIIRLQELKRFFSINTDIFLRTLCLVTVTMWFTRCGAIQGDTMLAVNTLLMQLFMLFSYMMDGFAFAGEALTGKYIGAKQPLILKKCIKALFIWSVILTAIFTLIYAFGGKAILGLLSNDNNVIALSQKYYWWATAIPIAGFMAFTWDGIYIGATATRAMLLSMFSATIIFFLLYFVLFPIYANHALWIAFLCYLFVRGIVLTLLPKKFL